MWRALDTPIAHAWRVSVLGSDYLYPACERLRGKRRGPTVTARITLDLAGKTGTRRCKLCERVFKERSVVMFDWAAIEEDIGTREGSDDPESILHELAHAYDLHGAKAFEYVGPQNKVGDALRERYPAEAESDEAELRASVVTHLTMVALNLHDERADIVSSMITNMRQSWVPTADATMEQQKQAVRDRFDALVAWPDRAIREAVDAIAAFVRTYPSSE